MDKNVGYIDLVTGFEGFHLNCDISLFPQLNEKFIDSINEKIQDLLKIYYHDKANNDNIKERWYIRYNMDFYKFPYNSKLPVYKTKEELISASVSKVKDILSENFRRPKAIKPVQEKKWLFLRIL